MNTALILAGGIGGRMNSETPKQYIEVKGRMVIEYCMKTLLESPYIDEVFIAADNCRHDIIKKALDTHFLKSEVSKFRGFSPPGGSRQLSVYNGLETIRKINGFNPGDKIFIHDAARPLLSHRLIEKCFMAMSKDSVDGVMPVLPVKDTMYICNSSGKIDGLLERSLIFAGQSPELFDIEKYYNANISLLPDKILSINGSSEPAVAAGMNIVTVEGEYNNFKITTPEDLEHFERIL